MSAGGMPSAALAFGSDTEEAAHPAVVEAVAAAASGRSASYGADRWTERLREAVAGALGTGDIDVWPCISGTAANALALAVLCPPTGAVLCHREAHIERDERGAPEFFTGGGKLQLLDGPKGKIPAAALQAALAARQPAFVHGTPAAAISLTQLTECGTRYASDEWQTLAGMAREDGLGVHLDGARFGNALAGSGLTATDWFGGVWPNFMTLGLTKCGAMGCDVVVAFGPARARFDELRARAKRAGHMPPKLRFLSAQGAALLEGGLWLELSKRANARAAELAAAFQASGCTLAYPVEGNEVFAKLSPAQFEALQAAGAAFYPWPGGSFRFVCSWATPPEAAAAVSALL